MKDTLLAELLSIVVLGLVMLVYGILFLVIL